jgi:hypothetical protein
MPETQDLTCTQYRVRPDSSGSWTAQIDCREAGPYASRDLALRVAITEALQLRAEGRAVRITVQDADGETCVERCLCSRFSRCLN